MDDKEWNTEKFVLVMLVQPKDESKRTWTRAFGPFDTRHQGYALRDSIVNADDNESIDFNRDNLVVFTVTRLWTEVK